MLATATIGLAAETLAAFRARGWRLATAESCTGGLITAALTQHAGSSDVVVSGFVTYANDAKIALGVKPDLIASHGAVSEPVARAMAESARLAAGTQVAVSVTGIAGPGGGSAEKPVGLVWFGLASADRATLAWRQVFAGDRVAIRDQATAFALTQLLQIAS